MEKTIVTYLGHSAWSVETPKNLFIFDYDKPPKKGSYIDLSGMKDKPVYFFSSHNHGDHYSKRLNQEVSQQNNMIFITGGFHAAFNNSITIMPRQTKNIRDISVYTAASTDIGVCYLVKAKGLTIFHSGDLANWPDNEETSVSYSDEIDYIASLNNTVDIAFIPVCTFDWHQDVCLLEGALYAVKKLNPGFVFPMHANGHEDLYKRFAKYAENNGIANSIICMERVGDTWICPEDVCDR